MTALPQAGVASAPSARDDVGRRATLASRSRPRFKRAMPARLPPDADALAAARRALAAADPAMAGLDARIGPFAWRTRLTGMEGLVRAIVGQQVSTVSADATWARLKAAVGGPLTADALLALDEAGYRACGFSGQKARYARGIAQAVQDGAVDFADLPADDDAALAALTALKGVGTWTAEVHLMMAEHRLDAFPAGDIAVQEAIRWLDGLDARPAVDDAYARAERWRPHRAVAAHLLWEWYVAVKAGDMPHPLTPELRASERAAAAARRGAVA